MPSRVWKDDLPETVLTALRKPQLVNSSGNGPDYGQWDGFPAEREMIYSHVLNHPGSCGLLSDDIHGGMAAGIRMDPSESPPRTQSLAYEAGLKQHLNQAKDVHLDGHGTTSVDVTPVRVQVECRHGPILLSANQRPCCDAVDHVNPGSEDDQS